MGIVSGFHILLALICRHLGIVQRNSRYTRLEIGINFGDICIYISVKQCIIIDINHCQLVAVYIMVFGRGLSLAVDAIYRCVIISKRNRRLGINIIEVCLLLGKGNYILCRGGGDSDTFRTAYNLAVSFDDNAVSIIIVHRNAIPELTNLPRIVTLFCDRFGFYNSGNPFSWHCFNAIGLGGLCIVLRAGPCSVCRTRPGYSGSRSRGGGLVPPIFFGRFVYRFCSILCTIHCLGSFVFKSFVSEAKLQV